MAQRNLLTRAVRNLLMLHSLRYRKIKESTYYGDFDIVVYREISPAEYILHKGRKIRVLARIAYLKYSWSDERMIFEIQFGLESERAP